MRNYKTIYTEVEVDVDLSDFETADLLEELESRGAGTTDYGDGKEVLQAIYEKRRLGKDYQTELTQLIYLGLGKIV
ncbi:MAG: hypothetical protein ACOVLB_03510 [Candidatus Nanopelagicus sp.]